MALDLEAIRKKLDELSGNRMKRLRIVDDKLYRLRIIAFPNNDGQPFKERLVYSIGRNWNLLAPYQFGRPCPIKELTDKLRDRTGKTEEQAKEDWILAKKLLPKTKYHAIVIDRDNQDAGPMIWVFPQSVAKTLYGFMLDEDYGDITCPRSGMDIKVKRTVGDSGFREYDIKVRPSRTPLGTDDEIRKWMSNLPSVDSLYEEKSYEELDQILKRFLAGDDIEDDSSDDASAERDGDTSTETDLEDVEDMDRTFENLDDAFDALMSEDD